MGPKKKHHHCGISMFSHELTSNELQMFAHTSVKDNRNHLLLCQFGFARQRLLHKLINGLDVATVGFVRTVCTEATLVTDDVGPFFERLGGYVVVAGRERVSASAPSAVLGTHRFFEVEIWSA
jgi:hypothetical protein